MGTLTYDSKIPINIDDRVLAHLQIVVWSKLRRAEAFAFTFARPSGEGSGRRSLWLSSNVSLTFQYFDLHPQINPAWVRALMKTANSPSGLSIVEEPVER